jgi:hypothetical protein
MEHPPTPLPHYRPTVQRYWMVFISIIRGLFVFSILSQRIRLSVVRKYGGETMVASERLAKEEKDGNLD